MIKKTFHGVLASSLMLAASGASAAMPVDNYSSVKYERTIAMLEPTVAQSPRDAEAWLNLGMAYLALGRAEQAHAALTQVTLLDNVTLQDRFGDDVWSRGLARAALARMPQLSAAR